MRDEKKQIVDILKKKKYRLTNSRLAMIDVFLMNSKKHLLIEDIINELEKKEENINISSVYNNLDTLVKEKIVEKYNFSGKNYYEYNKDVHGHFICENCKKTFNINVPGMDCLDMLIYKKYQAKVNSYKIEFSGICEDCQRKMEK